MSADADLDVEEVEGDPIGLVRQLELDELQELVTDLVQENEKLRERIDELESAVEKTNKRIEFITEDLVEVEKQAQSTVPRTRLEQMLVLSPEERRRQLTAHDLRRSWAQLCLEAEVEPGMLMEWGGWDNWETFRENYLGAYSPRAEREQSEKVPWL